MRAGLACGLAATLVGCATPPPVVEVVEIVCPSIAPPALYALPERRRDFVTPEDYAAERAVLEGRHSGFAVELGAWTDAWDACPGRKSGRARP